jgi:hypothetical protein
MELTAEVFKFGLRPLEKSLRLGRDQAAEVVEQRFQQLVVTAVLLLDLELEEPAPAPTEQSPQVQNLEQLVVTELSLYLTLRFIFKEV